MEPCCFGLAIFYDYFFWVCFFYVYFFKGNFCYAYLFDSYFFYAYFFTGDLFFIYGFKLLLYFYDCLVVDFAGYVCFDYYFICYCLIGLGYNLTIGLDYC